MRSYLVVANQTLVSEPLLQQIRLIISWGNCGFHLLVPATPIGHQLTWTEEDAAEFLLT